MTPKEKKELVKLLKILIEICDGATRYKPPAPAQLEQMKLALDNFQSETPQTDPDIGDPRIYTYEKNKKLKAGQPDNSTPASH